MENKESKNTIDFAREIEDDNKELLQELKDEKYRQELKERYKLKYPWKAFFITMAALFGAIIIGAVIKTAVEYKSSCSPTTQIMEVVTHV